MSRRRGSSHTSFPHGSSDRTRRTGRSSRSRSGDGAPDAADASQAASGGWVRHGTALPGWTDLEPSANRRRRTPGDRSFLENVSTGRFALLVLAIAGLFTLYIGHVHATTDLYDQLQEARAENQRLHLKHNRLKGAYDRRTGPSVIYERARELGLRESVTYGPPITTE
jgi:hypothetical protein